jgi:hypothetical protein
VTIYKPRPYFVLVWQQQAIPVESISFVSRSNENIKLASSKTSWPLTFLPNGVMDNAAEEFNCILSLPAKKDNTLDIAHGINPKQPNKPKVPFVIAGWNTNTNIQ